MLAGRRQRGQYNPATSTGAKSGLRTKTSRRTIRSPLNHLAGISLAGQTCGEDVLSRCANPQCSKSFLRLHDGKFFLVETERVAKVTELGPPFVRARQQPRQVEHYWLCNECSERWTLVYDHDRGVALAPVRRPMSNPPADSPAARSGAA